MTRFLLFLLFAAPAFAQPPKDAVLNPGRAGQPFELRYYLQAGQINIVHFDTGRCGLCPATAASLGELCQTYPQYSYRYVEVGSRESPLARQYNITGAFGFRIYDGQGRLLAAGDKAYQWLEDLYRETRFPDRGHFHAYSRTSSTGSWFAWWPCELRSLVNRF